MAPAGEPTFTINGRPFYWTTTDNTTADSHYLYDYRYIDPASVRVQYGPNGLEKVSVQENEPPMRGLFIVYIVDPETDEVITSPAIVAVDANSAKLKVLLKAGLAKDVDEYNIIVTQIGNVNARKRVQEVKVVKDK